MARWNQGREQCELEYERRLTTFGITMTTSAYVGYHSVLFHLSLVAFSIEFQFGAHM